MQSNHPIQENPNTKISTIFKMIIGGSILYFGAILILAQIFHVAFLK